MTTVRNITTDYTLTPHDAVQGNEVSTLVQVDTTGGPVTLTLPQPTSSKAVRSSSRWSPGPGPAQTH